MRKIIIGTLAYFIAKFIITKKMEEPLFITHEGFPIYHGDEYWAFQNESKTDAAKCIADKMWLYNDGAERFKFKETAQHAIEVFKWLNET
jgi:hypothetical protein